MEPESDAAWAAAGARRLEAIPGLEGREGERDLAGEGSPMTGDTTETRDPPPTAGPKVRGDETLHTHIVLGPKTTYNTVLHALCVWTGDLIVSPSRRTCSRARPFARAGYRAGVSLVPHITQVTARPSLLSYT